MIFSITNDGIDWSLDFVLDSVNRSVKFIVQGMTIFSQEIPLAAWKLLLCQKQDFSNIHLAQVLITSNQEETMDMRVEVLSSVRAQDMYTSVFQVSDSEDIELHREDPDLNLDAVVRPGVDTTFTLSSFNDFEIGSMAETSVLINEEQGMENSPSLPSTPVSESPTQHLVLMRNRPFRKKVDSFADYDYRILFEEFILFVCILN